MGLNRRSFFRLVVLAGAEMLIFPSALAEHTTSRAVPGTTELAAAAEASGLSVTEWLLPELWLERQLYAVGGERRLDRGAEDVTAD
ncbi:MAG TPA: hypothetical protein VGO93_29410 [Candidatus Xenobia bacterium]